MSLTNRLRGNSHGEDGEKAADLIDALRKELETERMRLAACGVVALANTEESALKTRDIHEAYKSGSFDDVCAAVNEQMRLRKELEKIANIAKQKQAEIDALRKELEQAKIDADRYRAFKEQHEGNSRMYAVWEVGSTLEEAIDIIRNNKE